MSSMDLVSRKKTFLFANTLPAYALFLKNEFLQLHQKNPSFSMRSFARHIGIDQSYLSKIFKGQKKLTHKTFSKIANRLEVSAETFNNLILQEVGRIPYLSLEEDYYQLVQDWLPFALIEFSKTVHFSPSAHTIAEYFKQPVAQVEAAIERLVRHQFITINEGGRWTVHKPSTAPQNYLKTSHARKVLQKQYIEMSLDALDQFNLDQRTHIGLTIAVPKEKFEEARDRLIEFHLEFGEYLQGDEIKIKPNEVYQLNLSFFPLTKQT